MKVSIAALGRFHAFDLAFQMLRMGHLQTLYTGYPLAKVPLALRPYAKTCPYLTVPMMLAGRYGWERLHNSLNVVATVLFDHWLCRVMKPCDVMHIWSSYGMFATRKAKKLGMKTICDRGSTHLMHQRRVLKSEYLKWNQTSPSPSIELTIRELYQYNLADRITVPSRFAADTFKDYEKTVSVVPYGVDLERFKAVPKEDKTFRVLYVGALSLRKGIPYLMQACGNYETWLVGTPLQETAEMVKRPNVKVWGSVPQDRLPWFYSQASVVVLPSIEEGLALVLGQSLACGVPVIATKESGVEELITDGVEGFVCKARDPQDIAIYLKRLYDYPDELDWMKRQIEKKRGEWHWNHYGERMVKVYEA